LKLLTFSNGRRTTFGAKVDSYIVDLPELIASSKYASETLTFPDDLKSYLAVQDKVSDIVGEGLSRVLENGVLESIRAKGHAYLESEITFLPPIEKPGKIICLGMNYRQHAKEMGREPPKYPTLFGKFANTLIGHKNDLVLPAISQMIDYEAELALVIGKSGKNIAPENVFDHIGGYTILNDVSVRDFQNRTLQWMQGKNFDKCCPVGPFLVTKDEIPNPNNLEIELKLNDVVMQQANTSDFIFDVRGIVSYISQIMTLDTGDIISTGTPSGVGVARDPQIFLRPGDVVRIELEKVGTLENTVVTAPD
jgi:acylpyruvate hydrolase